MIREAHECPMCLTKPKTLLQLVRVRKRNWFCSRQCQNWAGHDLGGLLGQLPTMPLEAASEGEDL